MPVANDDEVSAAQLAATEVSLANDFHMQGGALVEAQPAHTTAASGRQSQSLGLGKFE